MQYLSTCMFLAVLKRCQDLPPCCALPPSALEMCATFLSRVSAGMPASCVRVLTGNIALNHITGTVNLGNNLPAWIDGRGTLQYGTSALPRIERIWDKDRQTSQILEFLFRPCVTTLARTMCWTAGFSPLHITMYSPQFWMTGDTVFWCKTSHVSNKQVDIRWDVVQSQNETRPKWRQMNLMCNMPPTIIQPFRLVVTNSKNIPLTSLATVDSRHSFLPLQTHQALIGSCCQNQARTGHVQAMNKPKAIVEVV